MLKLQPLGWIALILVIVGAINWGLIGLFEFNLVETIFGEMAQLSRITYVIVGLAGLYLLLVPVMATKCFHMPTHRPKPLNSELTSSAYRICAEMIF